MQYSNKVDIIVFADLKIFSSFYNCFRGVENLPPPLFRLKIGTRGGSNLRNRVDMIHPMSLKKIFSGDFSMACREKMLMFAIFQDLYKQICLL